MSEVQGDWERLSIAKNALLQWFSSRKFREVLIFWCLKRARWKKIPAFQDCAKVVCFPAWLGHGVPKKGSLLFFYKRCPLCYTSLQFHLFGWPKPSSNECTQYLWFFGTSGARKWPKMTARTLWPCQAGKHTTLAQPWKTGVFFTWPFWDIKISKPP